MNTVKLFLGYRSASLGIFSCKNGLPVGKKHILREIVNQFDPSWLKGIYCGAYLNGADFPTFGMIAELRAESFASIGALSAKVKERFPESELWVTADFGWRRASCAVGMSVSSKPEDDAPAIAFYTRLLYDFYKRHQVVLRAFVVKEGQNLVLRSVGCRKDYADLGKWLSDCHCIYQHTNGLFVNGGPVLSRVYAVKK